MMYSKSISFGFLTLLCFVTNVFSATYVDYASVAWTETGVSKSSTISAGGTKTITPDTGTQVNLTIYKLPSAPPSVSYWYTDFNNGGNSTVTSTSSSKTFTNVAGPLDCQIWGGIDTTAGRVEIIVNWIPVAKPDLVVSNITVDGSTSTNQQFYVGQQVELKSIVWNNGGTSAGTSRLGYYIGASCSSYSYFDDDSVSSLSPEGGSSESVYYTFTSSDIGTRYFTFIADYKNSVSEAVEGNNIKCWGPFTVRNDLPTIDMTAPSSDVMVIQGQSVTISWDGTDLDDEAIVSIGRDADNVYNNGNHTWLALSQSEDGSYVWDTTGVTPGTYYIFGMIYDGVNPEAYDYAVGKVILTINEPQIDLQLYEISDSSGTLNTSDPGVEKNTFKQGETVRVTLKADNTGGSAGVSVTLNIKDPDGNIVYNTHPVGGPYTDNSTDTPLTNSEGYDYYSFDFVVPADSTLGNYSILAAIRDNVNWDIVYDTTASGRNDEDWANAWVTGQLEILPAGQGNLWLTVQTEDGTVYRIYTVTQDGQSIHLNRPLKQYLDGFNLTDIYIVDSSGIVVPKERGSNILLVAQSAANCREYQAPWSVEPSYFEADTRNNYIAYPAAATADWWRWMFIYSPYVLEGGHLDDSYTRANRYADVILDAVLQPDVADKLEEEDNVNAGLQELFKLTIGALIDEDGFDLQELDQASILTLQDVATSDGQTSIEDFTNLVSRISLALSDEEIAKALRIPKNSSNFFGKLSSVMGGLTDLIGLGATLSNDVARQQILQTFAAAAAADRLEAIESLRANIVMSDPAFATGLSMAHQRFEEYHNLYYEKLPGIIQTAAQRTPDLLLTAASLTAGMIETFGSGATQASAKLAGKMLLPYMLSWETHKLIREQVNNASWMTTAATITRSMDEQGGVRSLGASIIQGDIVNELDTRNALRLLEVYYYLGHYSYARTLDVLRNDINAGIFGFIFGTNYQDYVDDLAVKEQDAIQRIKLLAEPQLLTRHSEPFELGQTDDEAGWLLSLIRGSVPQQGGPTLSASFTVQGAMSGIAPFTATFIDTSTGVTSWEWVFGDGETLTLTGSAGNAIHCFQKPGIYSVRLVAHNGSASTVSSPREILVTAQKPYASFTANNVSGAVPLNVTFIDESIGTVDNWEWNFGDGTSSNEANPQHTYSHPGTYTPELRVSNGGGSTFTRRKDLVLVSGSTGTIQVTCNIDAGGYEIVGPRSYVGGGTQCTISNAPVGQYTVNYKTVQGYISPALQQDELFANSTVYFNGQYVTAPPPTNYIFSASVINGHGEIMPSSATYDSGVIVQLTAKPDSGYQVKTWSGTDNDSSKSTSNTVTMNGNKTVTVEFEVIPVFYLLNVSSQGQGTVQPESGQFNAGTLVSPAATPNKGWIFDRWEGDLTGSQNPPELAMDSDKSVTAVFQFTGDYDKSGEVDIVDLKDFAEQWLWQNCIAPAWCDGSDINSSGNVDLLDYAELANHWLVGTEEEPIEIVWVFINEPGFSGQMSKYETTNAQYCQYLNAVLAENQITVYNGVVYAASDTAHSHPYYNLAGAGITYDGAVNGGAARINYSGSSFTVDPGFENHPVTYVSWYGASAFCKYYGYRLPTNQEWQAVADYDGSYTYGCGTTINNNMANYLGTSHIHGTTEVGSFGPYGYGLCDMAGNVEEFISSADQDSYAGGHGGGWEHHNGYCVISYITQGSPVNTYEHVGFRVVKSIAQQHSVMAGGWFHSIAIKSDGTVGAWGAGTQNSGYPHLGQSIVPADLTDVVSVAAGGCHSLALKKDGTVRAWGWNNTWEMAYNSNQSIVPDGLNNVVAIAAGSYHSMALKSDGTVVGWGAGDGTSTYSCIYNSGQAAIPPDKNHDIVAIAAGEIHSLALKSDGTVIAWGANNHNQCDVPEGLNNVIAIAAGNAHNVALKSDGTVVAWGFSDYHQVDVPSDLNNVKQVTSSWQHNLALKTDGTVKAWGRNDKDQCDDQAGSFVSVAVGAYFSMAQRPDGTIVTWGDNERGQRNIPTDTIFMLNP